MEIDIHAFLAGFSGDWLYFVLGGFVGLASVAPPGWFVPAQTFAIAGGAIASAGGTSLPFTVLSVFFGATVGCAIGYGIGAWFSVRKPGWAPRGRLGIWWQYSAAMLDQRTGVAVVAGRWNSALRACLPNAAGISGVGIKRFLAWNALACAIWSPVVVYVGVLVERAAFLAQAGLSVVSAIVVLGIIGFLLISYRHWVARNPAKAQPEFTSDIVVSSDMRSKSEGDHL